MIDSTRFRSAAIWRGLWPDPPIAALAVANPRETAYMREVSARRIDGQARAHRGAWTALAAISPQLVAAAVKAEDPRFFDHHGVDWHAFRGAFRNAIRTRRLGRGASTITQQLARNLYLTPARSIGRKAREAALALRIERAVSKPRILELYLNLIEWGGGTWGCAAASAHYFQKAPRDLDLFESTFLVSLLPAPRATLAGRHALRSQHAQFALALRVFLSGLASGTECAACIQRVRLLHRLLAAGVPLFEALAASQHADRGRLGISLEEIAAELGFPRLDPADLIASRCGHDQQETAHARLRGRVGDDALLQMLRVDDAASPALAGPVI